MAFAPAKRRSAKLRLALSGVSGSGKTYTSIQIAKLLGTKVGVIDSERKSASLYARPEGAPEGPGSWDFAVSELDSQSPQAYLEAIKDAAREGIDALVIDSYSHSWLRALEQVDLASSKITGWRDTGPLVTRLVDAVLSYPGHVLCTFREKATHEVEKNERGQISMKKVGLAPVAREGMEYEFGVWLKLTANGGLTVDKSRCDSLPVGAIYSRQDIPEMVGHLRSWLDLGAPGDDPMAEGLKAIVTATSREELLQVGLKLNVTITPRLTDEEKTKLRAAYAAREKEFAQ